MKDQHVSDDEDQLEISSGDYCWWRSSTEYDESVNLKSEGQNLSKISPEVKILREMDRLALVSPEGLDDLCHKLIAFRAGDFWVPTGGVTKEDIVIPPVNTILLLGFHNAGKSSLVNLMYSVLGRSGLIPFAQTSSGNGFGYRSLSMEEHNVLRSTCSGFCVYDTRGFNYDQLEESLEELSNWMTKGVHHKEVSSQIEEKVSRHEMHLPSLSSYSAFTTRRVNCIMVVANVAEISEGVKLGDKTALEALKQLYNFATLKKFNENPILILTHGDMLPVDDRIDTRAKICGHLGISETTGTYDIVCVTEFGLIANEYDPISAYAVSEAVYRALLMSDRSHLPRKNFLDTEDCWLFLWVSSSCFQQVGAKEIQLMNMKFWVY
ncbi:hypothetical protein LIER_32479 [Lithospermum erythrorhizon]|uniref:Uncharacterized protein n=1 Tax=Lithospermum erythrorhizon TaxID=34254 RepID=A0AAV3RZB2_LITER